jgi:hypothetical protein
MMISTQLSSEAYQLAAEYQLGEPIRVYGINKRQQIKSSGWVTLGISLLFLFSMLMQNSFRLRASDLILYSICVFIAVIAALIIYIPILRAPDMTVYICTSGFIVLNQSSSEAVRWERIERVKPSGTNSPCVVYLADTNKPDIILSKYMNGLKELSEEIELKAQLAKHPEQTLDLERQVERSKNEQAERQQAGKLLYQARRQYLATKGPDEARTLGGEYRLGETLGTYRSGLCSLRQRTTLKHFGWAVFLAIFLVEDPQRGIQSIWPTGCLISMALFVVFFIAPRVASRKVRLHIYSEGFIFIHTSLDIICWEQIEKVVYSTGFFFNFCTFHLKNGEKLALSAYLEKQDAIKHVLDPKIQRKEVYPIKKVKDEYIDIGRLAD